MKKSMRNKRIPQRTCIVCRQKKDKNDLIRLVRTNSGTVEMDLSGKKPGRGAYLCARKNCWEEGFKRNHLEHALRTKIRAENRQALVSYGDSLSGGSQI